ncbi:hypothetical protein MBLNU230_g1728t2 [Neophaeotheca triangularis]
MATAQECISLAESSACPAFNASSISTDSDLVGLFPFLSDVTDVSSFDSQLRDYIAGDFVETRYEQLIGCDSVDLSDTDDFYARYTTSVLCNAIIQNSIDPCGLQGTAANPLCADSCASYAQSEQEIAASNVCGNAGDNALTQIRADFTNCALPADSITGSCIPAYENQPDDCGFTTNLGGLCSYCAASSPNSTDSCCVFAETESRCEDVTLPVVATSSLSAIVTTMTATPTSSPSQSSTGTAAVAAGANSDNPGLAGGQIAGIVVGAVLGALFLLALIIGGCLFLRKRRSSSPASSIFNQPATTRKQPPMAHNNDGGRDQERAGMAVLPGGRVARMSALERSETSDNHDTSPLAMGGAYNGKSSSSDDGTPEYHGLAPPPRPKRSGSLSSGSQLALAGAEQETSPSTDAYTSPDSNGQSERLAFFKDYYSQDEIHSGDLVSTLWAYEPRAADEFHLERGDMIKVIGIWDDGWATGVRVRQKAEDWGPPKKFQRDSAQSNTSGDDSPGSTDGEGEVKAFPLVCVCVPKHWRRTIEGDSTEGTG